MILGLIELPSTSLLKRSADRQLICNLSEWAKPRHLEQWSVDVRQGLSPACFLLPCLCPTTWPIRYLPSIKISMPNVEIICSTAYNSLINFDSVLGERFNPCFSKLLMASIPSEQPLLTPVASRRSDHWMAMKQLHSLNQRQD